MARRIQSRWATAVDGRLRGRQPDRPWTRACSDIPILPESAGLNRGHPGDRGHPAGARLLAVAQPRRARVHPRLRLRPAAGVDRAALLRDHPGALDPSPSWTACPLIDLKSAQLSRSAARSPSAPSTWSVSVGALLVLSPVSPRSPWRSSSTRAARSSSARSASARAASPSASGSSAPCARTRSAALRHGAPERDGGLGPALQDEERPAGHPRRALPAPHQHRRAPPAVQRGRAAP